MADDTPGNPYAGRHVTQFRPRGSPDALPYSPSRDVAHLFPAMAREAFAILDEDRWMDHFADWLKFKGITGEDLGKGVKAFVEAFHFYVGAPDVHTLHDAFQRTGFLDAPAPVRLMIFNRVGEVMAVGFFEGIRDTTYQGQEPPQIKLFADYVAAARLFLQRLHGPQAAPETPDLPHQIESLRVELESARSTLARQVQATQAAELACMQCKAAYRRLPQTFWGWLFFFVPTFRKKKRR